MTEKTMNEGRLAEIRYYAENDPDSYVRQVLRDLLAELSRLRAVLTQYEAIVEAARPFAIGGEMTATADDVKRLRATLEGVRSDG